MPFLGSISSDETLPARGAWDVTSAAAIEDFSQNLPSGSESYFGAVREFALDLYAQAAAAGETYFLDKTPPYAHFLPELARIFPEAKFVVLWRNPLAVVASDRRDLLRREVAAEPLPREPLLGACRPRAGS